MMRITRVLAGLALLFLGGSAQAQYNATFLETSRMWGMVVADFNNDGHEDIFICGHDANDRIWYWTASGYVPSAFVFANSDRHDCDAADVDGDGLLDLYCAVGADLGHGKGPKELWLQDAGNAFQKASNFGAEDIYGRGRIPVFFDLDHDGWPDIYLSNDSTPRPKSDEININHVYRNQRNGKFLEVKTLATGPRGFRCVAKGDVNGDGWDDLVTCNEQKNGHVYLNNHANDFTELAAPAIASWRDARLADMNGDGRDDLVVLTNTNRVQIWLNTGSAPYFTSAALDELLPAASKALTIGDFDHDGRADVYVVLARLDCLDSLHDTAPDPVYWGRPGGTWLKETQPQDYDGCGHLAATVDGSTVVLQNGGTGYEGPAYLIRWGP
jgi:hypothetical protein